MILGLMLQIYKTLGCPLNYVVIKGHFRRREVKNCLSKRVVRLIMPEVIAHDWINAEVFNLL